MTNPYQFTGLQSSGMSGGLQLPGTAASPVPAPPPSPLGASGPAPANSNMSASYGPQPGVTTTSDGGTVVDLGLIQARSLKQVQADEARRNGQAAQAMPVISGLASHLHRLWEAARMAKENTVEQRMIAALYARRGEYDPQKKAAIARMGGSDVYAQITSVKCRAATSWLRDVLLETGNDRAWGIKPTPLPELPPEINDQIVQVVTQRLVELEQAGVVVNDNQLVDLMQQMRDEVKHRAYEKACQACDRMADKMEDQMQEGAFFDALHDFLDDVTTFPSAILKGPVIRKKKRLSWKKQAMSSSAYTPVVTDQLVVEWSRVSPFDFYPSPMCSNLDDAYVFERHRLSRASLVSMRGTPGYDDNAIGLVLDEYGRGGLNLWLRNDVARADAEGKHMTALHTNTEGLIDALQFFGSVQGRMLKEWGLPDDQVPDDLAEYNVEAWLIGSYVIKAMINGDPLGRKPYYVTSYEPVPGSIWGNSVADLISDVQTVCNVACRSIVNNMAIASGPQVEVNVDLLQPGEDITTLTPWRIWQTKSDPFGNSGYARPPVNFFQPGSNVQELSLTYDKFAAMADEYSGIPRYLTGETSGGAGRTASGLSMLINNAGKTLKQVIANIDTDVMRPAIERLYFHNMLYADDADLKGDVQVVASGASALVAREAAQVRRNEFLAATANPIDMQIIGLEGRAEVLRATMADLDMDTDKIIPPADVLKQRAQMAMAAAVAQGQGKPGGGPAAPSPSGQTLTNGAPVTDNFSPPPAPGY